MLNWFSDDEREQCVACGEQAAVPLPAMSASYCLACGAIAVDGTRGDVDRPVAT
jgi:hypothetical protein